MSEADETHGASPGPSNVLVRPMTSDDLPALEELYYDFHEYHAAHVPGHLRSLGARDAWDRTPLREALTKILADGDAALFVAEEALGLVGLIEIYLRADAASPAVWPRRYVELQSLWIAEAARRQGLARRLVAQAAAWAEQKGALEIRLSVWEFNAAARQLYERLGFTTLKRRMAIGLDAGCPR